jgi:GAF domain-containing protein
VPSSDAPRNIETARALQQLVSMSLQQHSMESLLQVVADLTRQVLPGNPDASVSLIDGHQKVTVVSTGQLALQLDEVQYTTGVGPCLHAATTGELTEIPDTRTETRWAGYTWRAVEHGNLSSLSVPLFIDDDLSGALNIYAGQVDAFDDDARSAATGFAPYAAVAVKNMHDYQAAKDRARTSRPRRSLRP